MALWNRTINNRYQTTQNYECELLTNETFHMRERQNLDYFIWKQSINYSNDIDAKAKKIERKTKDVFIGADWNLNTLTREWCHRDGSKVFLDKNDSLTTAVLKDKLVARALAKALDPNTER